MSKGYYESQKAILDRMIEKDGLSTQEGSLNYNLHAPFSYEVESIKSDMDEIIKRNNIIDAYNNGYEEEVEKYCKQDGVERKQAKFSTGKITFYGTTGTQINAGYQFGDSANGLRYKTTQDAIIGADGSVEVNAISIEAGERYNKEANTLQYIPIKIVGVNSCTNKEAFKGGSDIETIDSLYYRDYIKVNKNPNGVNNAQFEEWALEVDGCGSCKVYACKDETLTHKRGHVCLVITNSAGRSASDELCKKVKDYIAPDEYGEGKVMMAILHVISATELPINLSFDLTLENGFTLDAVKANIEEDLSKYLKELKGNRISYTKLGSQLYKVYGVKEYDNLLINGATDNITLLDNQIPVLGSVTIS